MRDIILKKAGLYAGRHVDVLAVVSDSRHNIEDLELEIGVRDAFRELGPRCPFAAVLCWWTPGDTIMLWETGGPASLSATARTALGSLLTHSRA